jgi:hypothetical protein
MAYYDIADIIEWSKISQGLAEVDITKKLALGGGFVDKDLPKKIYLERLSLEDLYDDDPTSEYLDLLGNFVISLCPPYLMAAQAATGDGGSVSPSTPTQGTIYPFMLSASDFTWDGTNLAYTNTAMDGDNVIIFVNEFSQQWLVAPTYFTYKNGGGIFLDATYFPNGTTPLTIIVQKLNS